MSIETLLAQSLEPLLKFGNKIRHGGFGVVLAWFLVGPPRRGGRQTAGLGNGRTDALTGVNTDASSRGRGVGSQCLWRDCPLAVNQAGRNRSIVFEHGFVNCAQRVRRGQGDDISESARR